MVTVNRKASVSYKGTGSQTIFTFPFDYLRKDFVKISVFAKNDLIFGVDYTVSDKQVILSVAPSVDDIITIYRETTTDRLVSWEDASVLRAGDLTLFETQLLHSAEETQDKVQDGGLAADPTDQKWDARLRVIKNLSDPVDPRDAVNLGYFQSVGANYIQTFSSVYNSATANFNSLVTSCTNTFNSLVSSSTTTFNNLVTSSKDTFNALVASSTTAFNTLVAGATATINDLVATATNQKDIATTKATEASTSAGGAKASETNTKASETNAKASETNAKASETNAKASETNAAMSASSMTSSVTTATNQADRAKTEADRAKSQADVATTQATNAATSAASAAATAATVNPSLLAPKESPAFTGVATLNAKNLATVDQIPTALPANGGISAYANGLHRMDGGDSYAIRTFWDNNGHWVLNGYMPDSNTIHAGCKVDFADNAGSVPWSGVIGAPTSLPANGGTASTANNIPTSDVGGNIWIA